MATNIQLVRVAVNSNNGDLKAAHRLLYEAVIILEESPHYQRARTASSAGALLSLSEPRRSSSLSTPCVGGFHVAGGNINLFSHGMQRVTVGNLTKSCVELRRQWQSTARQVRKCWSSFSYSLVDGNADTFPEHSRKFHGSASRDLAAQKGVPQEQFPETAFVVSELIRIVNLTLLGRLEVADVHVFAQTSANCVFSNHLDLHVPTQFALNVILGVVEVATGHFTDAPLDEGGMTIDTFICQDPSSWPLTIKNGVSFPLRRTGDAALFRGSTHVHRTISPPVGFVVYKSVIFLQ